MTFNRLEKRKVININAEDCVYKACMSKGEERRAKKKSQVGVKPTISEIRVEETRKR